MHAKAMRTAMLKEGITVIVLSRCARRHLLSVRAQMMRLGYLLLPILVLIAALGAGDALAGDADTPTTLPRGSPVTLNLHVFGLSFHPDRVGTRVNHLDNELNVGLGLYYELRNDTLGVTSVESGFYRDSGRNWAKFAGVGYQLKLGERWRLGANLLAIQSETYNKGRAFVAPIPLLTYDFGPVKLNATYIPKVAEYNLFSVYAVYVTIPIKSW
jgi:hypothetical protein